MADEPSRSETEMLSLRIPRPLMHSIRARAQSAQRGLSDYVRNLLERSSRSDSPDQEILRNLWGRHASTLEDLSNKARHAPNSFTKEEIVYLALRFQSLMTSPGSSIVRREPTVASLRIFAAIIVSAKSNGQIQHWSYYMGCLGTDHPDLLDGVRATISDLRPLIPSGYAEMLSRCLAQAAEMEHWNASEIMSPEVQADLTTVLRCVLRLDFSHHGSRKERARAERDQDTQPPRINWPEEADKYRKQPVMSHRTSTFVTLGLLRKGDLTVILSSERHDYWITLGDYAKISDFRLLLEWQKQALRGEEFDPIQIEMRRSGLSAMLNKDGVYLTTGDCRFHLLADELLDLREGIDAVLQSDVTRQETAEAEWAYGAA